MPLVASVVSGPISKPCPAYISKLYISYCCIIDYCIIVMLYHVENFPLYISFCKIFLFAHYRLIMYISLFMANFFLYIHVTDKL